MYNQSLKHLLLSAFPIFLCKKRSLETGSLAGLVLGLSQAARAGCNS